MPKKRVIIDNIHEYDLKVKKNGKTTLKYSHSGEWMEWIKGETGMSLKDTGNSIKVLGLELGYDDAEMLYILLRDNLDMDYKMEILTV